MSKLIDKLKLTSQAVPQSIGFRLTPSAPPAKPTMLLIASLNQADISGLADYVSGADAGLWHILPDADIKPFHKAPQGVPDLPWGWWSAGWSEEEIAQVLQAGDDFMVFPATTTSLAILQNNEMGKILQVEASLNEGLLRTIDALPVDAVLVGGEPGENHFLTWHRLMFFQRAANLVSKPLLVTTPLNLAANELQALWEAGVAGVIVEVDTEEPAGRLNELRQTINQIAFPSRQRGKIEPLLPLLGRDTGVISEEDEEEE